MTDWLSDEFELVEISDASGRKVETVSYTHLDVYKRQTGRTAQANRRVLRFPQEDYRRTDCFHGADQASAVKTIQAGDNRPAFSV